MSQPPAAETLGINDGEHCTKGAVAMMQQEDTLALCNPSVDEETTSGQHPIKCDTPICNDAQASVQAGLADDATAQIGREGLPSCHPLLQSAQQLLYKQLADMKYAVDAELRERQKDLKVYCLIPHQ